MTQKKKPDFDEGFKRHAYLPRTKVPYMTLRKLRSLKSKHVGNKSWRDFYDYLVRDIPMAPTIHEQAASGTQQAMLNMWMHSYAKNLPFIRYGDATQVTIPENYHQSTIADLLEDTPVLEIEPDFNKVESEVEEKNGVKVKHPPQGTAVVVGRGPSLFINKHCEMLAKSGYQGLIVASDGGLIPCLEAGVVPHVIVTVDGAPVIKKFLEHPLVRENAEKMKWVTTVTVDHDVYQHARNIGLRTYWFQPLFDDWRYNESWTRLQVQMTQTEEYPRGIPRIDCGGNAGACAWVISMGIYKRSPVALIGIDFGYPEETKLENTQYYSSVLSMADGDVGLIQKAYKRFHHPTWNKDAFVDIIFYHYRQAFIEMNETTPPWYRLYGGTINCTEGGTLFGPNINCQNFADFLKEHPK